MIVSLPKSFCLIGLLLVIGLLAACTGDTATPITPTMPVSPLGLLPQLSGAEIVSQDDTGQLIYTASGEVAGAVKFIRRELAGLGWQEYIQPLTQPSDTTKPRILHFKKERQGLLVSLSPVSGHPNQVKVQYDPVALQWDLPALTNATEIEFSDRDLYLHYYTVSWPSQVVAFYRDTLPPQGWQELTQFSQTGSEVAQLYFKNPSRQVTTRLTATRLTDGRSEVILRAVSPDEIHPTPEPTATATVSPAPPPMAENDLSSAAATLSGIPLPGLVEDLNFDTGLGYLRYYNPAGVEDLATFYRRELAALGWQEDRSSAKVQASAAALKFRQGDTTMLLTLTQQDSETEVEINLTGPN